MIKPAVQTDRMIRYLDDLLLQERGIRRGQMFGHPAYYLNDKMFACVFGQAVALKVPEDLASELIANSKAVAFQPYGKRKMREWIQLSPKKMLSGEQRNTIQSALRFLRSLEMVD